MAALLIGGSTLLGSHYHYFGLPSFFYHTVIFLLFSTGFIFVYLYRDNNPATFLRSYLLTMVVKILAYLAFVLIMIIKDRAGAFGNVVFFMTVYFIFTGLEIGFLFHKINRPGKT